MAPDLECAREPIHIPEAIQPSGALLLPGPRPSLTVRVASANTQSLLGLSAKPFSLREESVDVQE